MYTHLKRYTKPANFADFADFDRTEYYVAYGRHRDSDTLTRSNFAEMLAQLGGETETVIVVRDSHWAVGWVESIYIHETDTAACATADRLLAKLEDYPVLNEDAWSQLEYHEACEYWERMSVAERVEWCQRYDVSVFAARRAEVPDDPRGELLTALAQ